MSRQTALALLVALSALYCLVELVPGRFVVTDEVYFKAAGRNWAATGRFAAPELKGYRSDIVPPVSDVFFAYPPLYPFLFGVYTKVVGFGPRSCILFDLLIHLLLVWLGALVARLVFGMPWGAAVLCGALLLSLGTAGRPDELGIAFALGAALALRKDVPSKIGIPIGGALLGLCCATSLGACLFLGSIVGCEVMLRERNYIAKARDLAATAFIALIVLGLCLAPILAAHPSAYRQLLVIGAGQTVAGNTGGGSHIRNSLKLWIEALHYGYDKVLLIAGCLFFCLACWVFDRSPERNFYARIAMAALSLLLLLVLMPGKYFYLWFAGSWLLIACVALAWHVARSLPPARRQLLFALGMSIWLIVSMPYFRTKTILWTLPADQSLTLNVNRVRAEVPAGAGVLTSEYWWALAGRNPVYETLFSNPGTDAFDFVVTTGNGSGLAGQPLTPAVSLAGSQWQAADNHLRATLPSLLGFPLSHSAYGFGPYILKKIK
jgi:hypothetical protein